MDGETSGEFGAEYPVGETSVQEAARRHGLRVAEIDDWKESVFS